MQLLSNIKLNTSAYTSCPPVGRSGLCAGEKWNGIIGIGQGSEIAWWAVHPPPSRSCTTPHHPRTIDEGEGKACVCAVTSFRCGCTHKHTQRPAIHVPQHASCPARAWCKALLVVRPCRRRCYLQEQRVMGRLLEHLCVHTVAFLHDPTAWDKERSGSNLPKHLPAKRKCSRRRHRHRRMPSLCVVMRLAAVTRGPFPSASRFTLAVEINLLLRRTLVSVPQCVKCHNWVK